MIEKLELPSSARLVCGKDYDLAFKYIKQTVNQLVDAVNKLQKDYDNVCIWVGEQKLNYNPDTTKGLSTLVEEPEPADPYAEQRRWIGKLCKFWDIDNNNLYYGPLTKIHDTSPYCYECNHKVCYANCEPVKDDIIYKGE